MAPHRRLLRIYLQPPLLASLPTKPVLILPGKVDHLLWGLGLCANYSDWEDPVAHLILPASPKLSFETKLSCSLSSEAFLTQLHACCHFVDCDSALPRLVWADCVRSIPFTHVQAGEILLDSPVTGEKGLKYLLEWHLPDQRQV